MLAEVRALAIAPVAGIPIVHELADGIELERRDAVEWAGTGATSDPVVIRHELGDARPTAMRPMLDVPPWCTFYLDERGEPASLFRPVFGEVDRLLTCEQPGATYIVRYGARPSGRVVALQSELTTFSFALAARGTGLIAHSCAFIAPNGGAVLCPGVSGTGKTTLARLLAEHGPAVSILTDDRAIVTTTEHGVDVWGSPWPGAARIAGTASAALSTVVFIRHGPECGVRHVRPGEAFRRIVHTLSMPLWEPARCGTALGVVDAIVSQSRLLEVAFPPTPQGVEWVMETVERSEPLGRDARR